MEIMHECGGESKKEKVLAMTIEELGFSVRTFTCLKRAGLNTVGDLVQLTEDDYYHVRNLGKKSFEELLQKLHGLGLSLKESSCSDSEAAEKVYAMSIGELDLPFQIRSSLQKAGIKTVKDLKGKTLDDIACLPKLNYKLATIVDDRLAALGFPLADEDWGHKIYIVYNIQDEKLVVHAATTSEKLAEEIFKQLSPKYRWEYFKTSPQWLEFSDRKTLKKLHEESKKTTDNVLVEPFATFEYVSKRLDDLYSETVLSHISNIKNDMVVIPQKTPWGEECANCIQNYDSENNSMESVVDEICRYKMRGLVVPEGIYSIGYSAFSFCSQLSCVYLPSSLTSICDSAFAFCSKLESITIPDNVRTIGDCAFLNCSELRYVKLPAGLTHIGEMAFADCANLQHIIIPDNCTVAANAFQNTPYARKHRGKNKQELYLDDDDYLNEEEYFDGFEDEDGYYDGEE